MSPGGGRNGFCIRTASTLPAWCSSTVRRERNRGWTRDFPPNGTKTNMAPLRGWAPVGQRIRAKVPQGHWKTMTFLAALRHDRVDAPWLIDGPINGDRFLLYVEKVLAPTLKPGDIVVM